ncbi:glycosyltransferase family 4 protein [Neobacillus sp. 114]|uniref:glycosyltransferase family 4 protein n=1 Tax=Neobacillus sp. 114 TaxID=3048535 RepID=UPI0024C2AF5D|nr:glycosyltransferase family 4 protein [Neobacillus sp. 114]
MPNMLVPEADLKQSRLSGRNIKLLMLCWEYPPNVVGGLARHVYGLSVHLAKMGYEVHVITAGDSKLPDHEIVNQVNIHRVFPINELDENFLSWIGGLNLAMAFRAEKLAEEISFDLIHAHDWLVGAAAITLKELLDIPLLTTIHATEHGRNNGIFTETQRFIHEKEEQLMSESNQLIVCSSYMKEHLAGVFQADDKKVIIIPNGVEEPSSNMGAGEVNSCLQEKKYIFSIGRIVKEKGFETIIEAGAIAKEKGLDYFFVVAGKGPMLETYRLQVQERQLAGQIAFVGYITDEQRNTLIDKCSMAVIPSLYEPFGIVALETMVFGKPTILSNTGGMKGIIKHLQTGLLMNPGDAESMLEQIGYLTENPAIAEEIGSNGKEIVKSLFGWSRIASETGKVMGDMALQKKVNETMKK